MNRGKKMGLAIAGGLIVCGCILISLVSMKSGITGIYVDTSWKIKTVEKDNNYDYDSPNLKDITEIEVDIRDQNILIESSEDEFFHVHIDNSSEEGLDVQTDNGKIYISDNRPARFISWDFSFFSGDRSNAVTIYIPDGSSLEECNLKTSDGNIISKAEVNTKKAVFKTSAGNITVTNLESDDTDLHTSDGNISLSGKLRNNIILKTSSGNIEVEGSCEGTFSAQSSDGNISLITDAKRANSSITCKTSDGVIRINDDKMGSKYSETNSRENIYNLKTSDGNIEIEIK